MAQVGSAEDKASARVLGTEAVGLAAAGNCAGAIPKFEAAEKLFHAPTTLEGLGECQINVGKLVAGTESLNRVVREVLPPNAPPAFVAAQQRAQKLLTAALPRIGKLRIHVDGAPPDQVTVVVDGANVPSALLDADRPTDPGKHSVSATAPGFKVATAELQLADGQEQSVRLTLEPDPHAQITSGPPTVPPPPPPPPPDANGGTTPVTGGPTSPPPASEGGGSKGPAIGAFAVGAAGLVVGTIFGVMALGTKSTLDNQCVSMSCPPSSQSTINTLGTQATVSTIGFGVGIVGAVVGVVLLVTSHGSSSAPPAAALQVTPWMGVGASGLGGTF